MPLKLLADTECEELHEALVVNVLGPFRLTKALFGALTASAREGRGAAVVNISSDAAVSAYSGWGAYGAAKAALSHMTAIWAEEAKGEGVSESTVWTRIARVSIPRRVSSSAGRSKTSFRQSL